MRNATLGAIVLAAVLSGCAVQSTETNDHDVVRATEAALSKSPKLADWILFARATYDATTDSTTVQLDTRDPILDPPIIDTDRYLTVVVVIDRGDGLQKVVTLRSEQIGPGGGCIFFKVPAKAGHRLFIGAVVMLTGVEGARVGAVPGGAFVTAG